jgi:predicted aminopeptidase
MVRWKFDRSAGSAPKRSLFFQLTVGAFLLVVLGGCESLGYYHHLVFGQLRILSRRQQIAAMVADETVPDALRSKLEFVLKVREFARSELFLPVDNHYLSYVDLQRSFAAWNVYAASEFSLQPRVWRYPIIGQAAYRGFFSEEAARAYAEKLAAQGDDTYVGGAVAYSTLGWFDDPVFSTMLQSSHTDIAALLFHELAHQILYVADDTAFNESFASAVEQEGIRRWLERTGDLQSYRRFLTAKQRQGQFVALVADCRRQLETVYDSGIAQQDMRLQKAAVFIAFLNDYEKLKLIWDGYSGYDAWVYRAPLNNAKLVSVAVYRDYVPAFFQLLHTAGNDLQTFYTQCRSLAAMPKEQRDRRMAQLLETLREPKHTTANK